MKIEEKKFQFNRQKFKAVVHYICSRCSPDELGAVKLNKVLYFADMLYYASTGEPLTGETYKKQQFGPVSQHILWALRGFEQEGALEVRSRNHYGYPKKDYLSKKAPDSSQYSLEEQKHIDEYIGLICKHSAKEISELSHTSAWELAEFGEAIPYFTVSRMFPVVVTDEDFQWAEEEAGKVVDSGQTAPVLSGDVRGDI